MKLSICLLISLCLCMVSSIGCPTGFDDCKDDEICSDCNEQLNHHNQDTLTDLILTP